MELFVLVLLTTDIYGTELG